MPYWTTKEVKVLQSLYSLGSPPASKLAELLPRHPVQSIRVIAGRMGLTRPNASGLKPHTERREQWLRIAHEHFARREAGLLA